MVSVTVLEEILRCRQLAAQALVRTEQLLLNREQAAVVVISSRFKARPVRSCFRHRVFCRSSMLVPVRVERPTSPFWYLITNLDLEILHVRTAVFTIMQTPIRLGGARMARG